MQIEGFSPLFLDHSADRRFCVLTIDSSNSKVTIQSQTGIKSKISIIFLTPQYLVKLRKNEDYRLEEKTKEEKVCLSQQLSLQNLAKC